MPSPFLAYMFYHATLALTGAEIYSLSLTPHSITLYVYIIIMATDYFSQG